MNWDLLGSLNPSHPRKRLILAWLKFLKKLTIPFYNINDVNECTVIILSENLTETAHINI